MEEPVASRDEERLLGAARTGNHPVDKKPSPACVQHDFSIRNIGNPGPLHGNQITGKDGRHHTGAEHTKTNFSKCADNFSRKITSQNRRCIGWLIHRRARRPAMRLFCCACSYSQ